MINGIWSYSGIYMTNMDIYPLYGQYGTYIHTLTPHAHTHIHSHFLYFSDGISMGTTENKTKGFVPREKFSQARVDCSDVKGVEACDRTFVALHKNRKALQKLVSSSVFNHSKIVTQSAG